MLFAAAHLPDAFVRLLPIVANPIETMTDADPEIVGNRADVFVVEIEGVQEFAVDVRLILVGGIIADADRRGVNIPGPMIQRVFGGYAFAEDREYRGECLAGVRMFGGVMLQPIHEAGGFFGESQTHECVYGEGGIANPSKAIVPVAGAADDFGKAGGGGGDDRSRGLERE